MQVPYFWQQPGWVPKKHYKSGTWQCFLQLLSQPQSICHLATASHSCHFQAFHRSHEFLFYILGQGVPKFNYIVTFFFATFQQPFFSHSSSFCIEKVNNQSHLSGFMPLCSTHHIFFCINIDDSLQCLWNYSSSSLWLSLMILSLTSEIRPDRQELIKNAHTTKVAGKQRFAQCNKSASLIFLLKIHLSVNNTNYQNGCLSILP